MLSLCCWYTLARCKLLVLSDVADALSMLQVLSRCCSMVLSRYCWCSLDLADALSMLQVLSQCCKCSLDVVVALNKSFLS